MGKFINFIKRLFARPEKKELTEIRIELYNFQEKSRMGFPDWRYE